MPLGESIISKKGEMCFGKRRIKFLDHITEEGKICMDMEKVKANGKFLPMLKNLDHFLNRQTIIDLWKDAPRSQPL